MALVSKILEATLTAGSTTVTFTDSDIPNSLIRVFSSNSDIIPESRILSGNTLTVTYAPQSNNIDVAVEIVKAGLDIVDNLTSTDADKALSAKQGKALKDDLDTLSGNLDTLSDNLDTLTGRVDNLDIPDNITDLDDVTVTNIQSGQVLAWDATEQKFVNTSATAETSIKYSSTPQKIGSWIDNRDVMLCVYDLGSDLQINNNSFTNTNIDATDMSMLINAKGMYSSGVTSYNLLGNINNNILRLQADRNDNFIYCRYVIVTYVKGV